MRPFILGIGVVFTLMACRPTAYEATMVDGEWVPNLRVIAKNKGYETVRYSRAGVPLYAEIYRPEQAKGALPAVVLMPGGFVGVNSSHRDAAKRLAKAGYLVALPHMRGQGKSGGTIDFGVEDAVDARGLAHAMKQVGGRGDFAYVGISLGGAIAKNAARNDAKARGIVSIMAPTDFKQQREMLIGWGRHEKVERWDGWIGGSPDDCAECYEQRDPLKHSEEVAAPVMFIQAGEDVLIPVSQACRWAETRRTMGRKVFTVALTNEGKPWKGTLKERQKCVMPFTGWGDWKQDHLVFFPALTHTTNEAVWRVTLDALKRWFE